MTDTDFLTEVRSAFRYLEANHGFQLVRYEPPTRFDNALVDFVSEALRIRVGREREQAFIEVGAAAGSRQYDLQLLARLLGEGELERRSAQPAVRVADLAPEFEPLLPRLVQRFGAAERLQTVAQLEGLGHQRAEELFGPAT